MSRVMQFVHSVTNGTGLQPTVLFDEAALAQRLNDIASSAGVVFLNARAIRTKTGFDSVPSKAGRTFNVAEVLPHLTAQLHDIDAPSSLAVAMTGTDAPAVITDAQAQAAVAAATAMSLPVTLANGGQTWTIPENVVHSWISFKVVNGNSIEIGPSRWPTLCWTRYGAIANANPPASAGPRGRSSSRSQAHAASPART
jgi:hypothetical protein